MTRRRWFQLTGGAAALVAATLVIDPLPRLMWNATASVPIGLYAIAPGERAYIGDIVAVMPPRPLAEFLAERGYLPVGVPLLKHVAALPGQRVCRAGGAVTIDGVVVAVAQPRDRLGRPLPVWSGCRRIAAGEVFLLNADTPDSLDGRYFGPLPTASILGRATPLWTDPPRPYRAAAD